MGVVESLRLPTYEEKYRTLVRNKLDDYFMETGDDIYDFAWKCGLSVIEIEAIWYWWASETIDILKLAQVSACIDAIQHNRFYSSDWQIIKKEDENGRLFKRGPV